MRCCTHLYNTIFSQSLILPQKFKNIFLILATNSPNPFPQYFYPISYLSNNSVAPSLYRYNLSTTLETSINNYFSLSLAKCLRRYSQWETRKLSSWGLDAPDWLNVGITWPKPFTAVYLATKKKNKKKKILLFFIYKIIDFEILKF